MSASKKSGGGIAAGAGLAPRAKRTARRRGRLPEQWVEILEAKPNKMFTEHQRSTVRFLRYRFSIPCAECGKRRRVMWTMLVSFRAHSMGGIFMTVPGETRLPLTPVCGAHPLEVVCESDEKEKKKRRSNHGT